MLAENKIQSEEYEEVAPTVIGRMGQWIAVSCLILSTFLLGVLAFNTSFFRVWTTKAQEPKSDKAQG